MITPRQIFTWYNSNVPTLILQLDGPGIVHAFRQAFNLSAPFDQLMAMHPQYEDPTWWSPEFIASHIDDDRISPWVMFYLFDPTSHQYTLNKSATLVLGAPIEYGLDKNRLMALNNYIVSPAGIDLIHLPIWLATLQRYSISYEVRFVNCVDDSGWLYDADTPAPVDLMETAPYYALDNVSDWGNLIPPTVVANPEDSPASRRKRHNAIIKQIAELLAYRPLWSINFMELRKYYQDGGNRALSAVITVAQSLLYCRLLKHASSTYHIHNTPIYMQSRILEDGTSPWHSIMQDTTDLITGDHSYEIQWMLELSEDQPLFFEKSTTARVPFAPAPLLGDGLLLSGVKAWVDSSRADMHSGPLNVPVMEFSWTYGMLNAQAVLAYRQRRVYRKEHMAICSFRAEILQLASPLLKLSLRRNERYGSEIGSVLTPQQSQLQFMYHSDYEMRAIVMRGVASTVWNDTDEISGSGNWYSLTTDNNITNAIRYRKPPFWSTGQSEYDAAMFTVKTSDQITGDWATENASMIF